MALFVTITTLGPAREHSIPLKNDQRGRVLELKTYPTPQPGWPRHVRLRSD
ncbi:hypothetical protein Kisp01_71220 [Kineosporia sp. NBRC 101677]|nr:hypothetical protein Kisp01_71220 [Kineosporia sp. NBRC 101677]